MIDYKEIILKNVIKTNQKNFSKKDCWKFVNYLDTGNITENTISDIQLIDLKNDKLPSRAKRKVSKNNIIYSTVRPNQKHFGFINKTKENFVVSTGFCVIEVDEKLADPKYIYYFLTRNTIIESLQSIAEQSVSTYPAIKAKDIEKIKIKLPNLSTQKKIASILSSLDDKIELNNKINKNLEEMAQAIFKSWFVDFEPWDGEMPDDWEYGTLGDYCSVKSGYAFKSASWTKTGVKVVKIKNITSNNNIDLNGCSYVSEKTSELAKSFILNKGDIIISMTGATIGKFAISPQYDEKILVNQRVGKFFIEGNSIKKIPFLYCCLKQEKVINEIINRGQGSAQPNISASDILSIPQIIPSEALLNKFNNNISTIIQYYLSKLKQNRKLINLRNTLLPKLMSGELDVSNLEI